MAKDEIVATMNSSLPNPMKAWFEEQIRGGRYSNASNYVRALIRRDQDRAAKISVMQTLVDEGLASGVAPEAKEDILDEARQCVGVAPTPDRGR